MEVDRTESAGEHLDRSEKLINGIDKPQKGSRGCMRGCLFIAGNALPVRELPEAGL